jgi:hypothetical protein
MGEISPRDKNRGSDGAGRRGGTGSGKELPMRSDLERERVVGFRPFAALRGLLQPAWDSCLSSFWVGRPGSPLDVAMGLHVGLLFFRSTFNAVRPRRLSTSRFHSARPARKKNPFLSLATGCNLFGSSSIPLRYELARKDDVDTQTEIECFIPSTFFLNSDRRSVIH